MRLVKSLKIIAATPNLGIFDPFEIVSDGVSESTSESTTSDSDKFSEASFKSSVRRSAKTHYELYRRFSRKDCGNYLPHVKYLIHRYNTLGFLNNISLSVCPNVKADWGITHELFGAFYNSNTTGYCSLFPDLETNSLGNALYFKPGPQMGRRGRQQQVILINPPYTTNFIKWSIVRANEWKGLVKMDIVLPIWDDPTRRRLGLSKQPDFPEITSLLKASDRSSTERLTFYDGIHDKRLKLKDKVHVIVINRCV